MHIEAPTLQISAKAGFKLEFVDRGNAAVAMKAEFWQGNTKVDELFFVNAPQQPPKSPTKVVPGQYEMWVTIGATKTKKLLGNKYDSRVNLIDQGVSTEICRTKGTVPASKLSDFDAEVFDLTVTA